MFEITDAPPAEALEAIGNGLAAFNAADVGPSAATAPRVI